MCVKKFFFKIFQEQGIEQKIHETYGVYDECLFCENNAVIEDFGKNLYLLNLKEVQLYRSLSAKH